MSVRIEGEPLNLRGHHLAGASLLALSGHYYEQIEMELRHALEGAGYGAGHADQVVKFWRYLKGQPELEIKLINTLDSICLDTSCPRTRPSCSSEEGGIIDKSWIESFGLELNGTYTVRQIGDVIKDKIELILPGLKL